MSDYFKKWLMWNLGGGALALLAVCILLLLIGGDISGRAEGIASARENLAGRLQALDSLISLRMGSTRAKDLLPKLQNSLPSKDQLIGFSKFLETIAKADHLDFSFSFLDEIAATDATPSTNNFILTLSGSYNDFLRFVKDAEASPYFMSFNSFEVVAKGPVYEAVIKGKIFSQ